MVVDINYTNFGDHFAIYKHIGLIYCTSKINIMLCIRYNSIKKKLQGE